MPESLDLVGTRPDHVENYTFQGYEVTARLFLPAFGPNNEPHSWQSLADSAGIPLTAQLRWSELEPKIPADLKENIVAPYAQVHKDTASAMVAAMTNDTDLALPVFYAVWDGYRDDRDPNSVVPFPEHAQSIAESHDDLTLHSDTTETFIKNAEYQFLRCPVFWWPQDLNHVIACPLYSDSLYFSGSRELYESLRAHGVEILEISPDEVAPHEGD